MPTQCLASSKIFTSTSSPPGDYVFGAGGGHAFAGWKDARHSSVLYFVSLSFYLLHFYGSSEKEIVYHPPLNIYSITKKTGFSPLAVNSTNLLPCTLQRFPVFSLYLFNFLFLLLQALASGKRLKPSWNWILNWHCMQQKSRKKRPKVYENSRTTRS